MKVLFLSPHVRTDHPVVQGLQAKGLAVVVAANSQEAIQLLSLHGSNLELAIVHREEEPGKDGEGGFRFVAKLKASPQYAELPLIIASHRWTDSEFAKHQETPQGANAYLRWPFAAATLYAMIEAVFGGQVPRSDASRTLVPEELETDGGTRVDMTVPKTQPPAESSSGGLVLEDASSLFMRTDQKSNSDTSIRLEMPDTDFNTSLTGAQTNVNQATNVTNVQAEREDSTTVEPPSEPAILLERPADIPLAQDTSVEAMLDAPADGTQVTTVDVGVGGLGNIGGIAIADISDGKTTVGLPNDFAVNDGLTTVGLPTSVSDDYTASDGKTTVGIPSDATTVQGFPASLFKRREAPEPAPREEPDSEPTIGEPTVTDADFDAAQEMPYLYPEGHGRPAAAAVAFALPLGDAVVPGGAANAPDVETLKKYLLLREQDVAVLSTQLKAARDQVKAVEEQLRVERARNSELGHVTTEQRRKLDESEKEKQHALDSVQAEVNDVRFQLKAKSDKVRVLESQVRESTDEIERLKERVRSDIRKIRVREKELENRLEIVKKDSEALIAARENKIVELKRKLDLLEFNMDLLQDQHSREKENAAKLRERLARAAQVVRVAGGLLDNPAGASQLAAVLAGEPALQGDGSVAKSDDAA